MSARRPTIRSAHALFGPIVLDDPAALARLIDSLGPDARSSTPCEMEMGLTPIRVAADLGHEACLSVLLERGFPLGPHGLAQTPLFMAAAKGRRACVEILLPLSDLEFLGPDGLSPSQAARAKGHDGVAELIDGYARAQAERAQIADQSGPAQRAASPPRI